MYSAPLSINTEYNYIRHIENIEKKHFSKFVCDDYKFHKIYKIINTPYVLVFI